MKIQFKICLALIAFVVCACNIVPEEASGSLSGNPSASLPAAAPPANAASSGLAALNRALDRMTAIKTFRASMTTSGLKEGKVETRIEAVLPDRFHVTNDQFELTLVGSDVYRKSPAGLWEKSITGSALTTLLDPKKLEEYLATSNEVKLLRSETLDNTLTQVYEIRADHLPPKKSPHEVSNPFIARVWVAVSDGLPRKLEGIAQRTRVKTTVVYYDYNARITINRPPVPER
jgi:hypothetical protein